MRACSRPFFRKLTVFQILFRISQSNGRKEIEKHISYRTGERTWERGWRTLSTSQLPIGHFRVPKALTFKLRPSAQPFLRKWVLFAWEWKVISISNKSHNGISKAEYLTSFWNRGPGELGNGLLKPAWPCFSPTLTSLTFYGPPARLPREVLRCTYF